MHITTPVQHEFSQPGQPFRHATDKWPTDKWPSDKWPSDKWPTDKWPLA